MCDPVIFASLAKSTAAMFSGELGIQALQTAVGFAGAQAAAQSSANAAAVTQQSAVNAAQLQYYAENLRLKQEGEAASVEAQQVSIDRKKQVGTAMASSAGAGLSLEYLLSDYYNQEGRIRSTLDKQLDWAYDQAKLNKKGHEATSKDRVNAAKASVLPTPSGLAAGVNLAGTALGTYTKYYGKA